MCLKMLQSIICVVTLLFSLPAFALQASFEADVNLLALEKLQQESSINEEYAGVATFYADKFIGRRTSSGQPYHPERMTAAHATLPLNTLVQVFNPATGQGVQVVINDRCRKRPFQLIDLSRAAARKIGLSAALGTMPVLIIPVTENRLDELLQAEL
ncbi:MAG: septal ring lytic transglycosylase RlpA family protein [Trichlorobacter sp.]|nr:septal ring lytic transglycosylase RlpA family protein [Trichlorobacter sp.]